jgi:hypothetical protein
MPDCELVITPRGTSAGGLGSAVNDLKKKFAVLVASCDAYSDLWESFFKLFWRFWPDCPFNVYLLSNKRGFSDKRVKNLLVGDDISWSDNLRKGIKDLKEEYVLLHLDDLFLRAPVETERVIQVFQWIAAHCPNYVKMNRQSKKFPEPENELLARLAKGDAYRLTTAMSVWRKQTLLDLLRKGESAWDFEIDGTVRSDRYDDFYSARKDCFLLINTVVRGKWQPFAIRKLRELGVPPDYTKRSAMSRTATCVFVGKQIRSILFGILPSKYRRGIRDLFFGRKRADIGTG